MYERFYDLGKSPFHITPDPEFLFLSRTHREALAAIAYGVERRKGFVVITGEVGVGKTTVLRSCLARFDPQRVEVIYVLNPNVTFKELVRTICRELDLRVNEDDPGQMVSALHDALIAAHRQGKNVLLIIDEAQNMPVATLEELRMLSNLETSTEKFLQIVLVGQPELDRKLSLVELRQLKQRIVIRAVVVPFSTQESHAYIEHRLRKAGGTVDRVFTPAAVRQIVRAARGIPRVLNILCDNTLISGFGSDCKPVSARIVREVVQDFSGQRKGRLLARRWITVGATAVVAAGVLFVLQPWTLRLPGAWMDPHLPERAQGADVSAAATPLPGRPDAGERPAASPPAGTAGAALTPPPTATESGRLISGRARAGAPSGDGRHHARDVLTTWTVRPGDTLSGLAVQVYGFSSDRLLAAIQHVNPGIADVNTIAPGTVIRFPRSPKI